MQKTKVFSTWTFLCPALKSINWNFLMRVSTCVIIGVLLNGQLLIASPGLGQGTAETRLDLNYRNTVLKKVFKAIESKADVVIMYELTQKAVNEKVDISVKDETVSNILDLLLKDKNMQWHIRGNIIRIDEASETSEKGVDLKSAPNYPRPVLTDEKPQINITGSVINHNLEPLAGATVVVKRTGKGTQTDARGRFSLKNVEHDDELVVSYIGYKQTSIKVGDGMEITIKLPLAQDELDVAIVKGYGTTTRRLSTGNIVKVTAEEIRQQPITNPLLALEGRVAGLQVAQTSGYASAPIKVELRGRSTVGEFPSDPLYIIDGVPLTVLDVGSGGTYPTSKGFLQNRLTGPADGQSPLFSVNPADIESIEILKDADATAIYGSRGANGVILITTKKGKPGRSQFNIGVQQGITRATRFWDLLNTQQYLTVRQEAFANDVAKYGENNQTIPNDDNALRSGKMGYYPIY